jgi:hypothetical protein
MSLEVCHVATIKPIFGVRPQVVVKEDHILDTGQSSLLVKNQLARYFYSTSRTRTKLAKRGGPDGVRSR